MPDGNTDDGGPPPAPDKGTPLHWTLEVRLLRQASTFPPPHTAWLRR